MYSRRMVLVPADAENQNNNNNSDDNSFNINSNVDTAPPPPSRPRRIERDGDKMQKLLKIVLKIALHNAYNEDFRINDSNGNPINESDVAALLLHALSAGKLLIGEEDFIRLLYEADVNPNWIVNENVKVRLLALRRQNGRQRRNNPPPTPPPSPPPTPPPSPPAAPPPSPNDPPSPPLPHSRAPTPSNSRNSNNSSHFRNQTFPMHIQTPSRQSSADSVASIAIPVPTPQPSRNPSRSSNASFPMPVLTPQPSRNSSRSSNASFPMPVLSPQISRANSRLSVYSPSIDQYRDFQTRPETDIRGTKRKRFANDNERRINQEFNEWTGDQSTSKKQKTINSWEVPLPSDDEDEL